MEAFKRYAVLIFLIALVFAAALTRADDDAEKQNVEAAEPAETTKLEILASLLNNGKPTFAYFYYSVACSCTAVQCSLASDAIAGTAGLNDENKELNYIAIDAFHETAAESLYQCQIVPLIIGFSSEGEEISRIDWDVNKEAIEMILNKIKK